MAVITPIFEAEIYQGGKVFDVPAVRSIEVRTSRDTNPDTASIFLPSMQHVRPDSFHRGDEVIIKFGHKEADYRPQRVFWGVIASVDPNPPISIHAKDWWWVISRAWHKSGSKSLPEHSNSKAGLNEIARDIIENPGKGFYDPSQFELITSPDYNDVKYCGQFFIGNRSYGEIFESLMQQGWDLFMLPGTRKIWFGPRNNLSVVYPGQTKIPIFRSGLNILNSDLSYNPGSGIKWVEVRAFKSGEKKSNKPDGYYPREIEFRTVNNRSEFSDFKSGYAGDKYGDVKKYDIEGLDTSKHGPDVVGSPDWLAHLLYARDSKAGLGGELRSFGLGFFQHWMKCKLEIGSYRATSQPGLKVFLPIINDHYFPSGVDYVFSPSEGFKMTVKFEGATAQEQEG